MSYFINRVCKVLLPSVITASDNKNIKFCKLNKRKIPLFQQVEILKIMLKITVFEIVVYMLLLGHRDLKSDSHKRFGNRDFAC